MKNKYQLFGLAVAGAAVLLVGVLVLGALLFTQGVFSAPVAEAKPLDTTAAIGAAQATPVASRTITVVGEGKVRTQPDTAQASIGVEVVGRDIQEATSEAGAIMEQLLNVFTEQGIAEQDIQTSYYNVWVERPFNPESGQAGEPIYHVNNNVTVTIRDLNTVTTVLGAAIEAGANSINGVTFSVADPAELQSEARQRAVDDAMATAQELASMNGVTVGEVVSVNEVISAMPYYFGEQAMAAQGLGGGGAGPISPGEVEVTTQLAITYAIE
jgi:uncharacterized protein YggE